MKLLFYNHTGQVSGGERMLLLILARLDRNCFSPVLVCPAQGPLTMLAAEAGVRCESINTLQARFTWRVDHLMSYLWSFLSIVYQLRRQVVDADPDLVHANSIRSGLVATVATIGFQVPVVWHLHDLLPKHPLSTVIRLFAFASGRVRLLAISEAVAQSFCGRVLRPNTVKVVHNGIEIQKFQPDPVSRQAVRIQLGLNDAKPVIGIVGQLTPWKGQVELIRAFAQVLPQMPQAMLLVVGAPLFEHDREYLQLLNNTVDTLGIADRVRFLGLRNDIPAIMQSLDLLVVNSWAEPFGLVIVEAMAVGTLVVATASGGCPEIIQHGETGWLVPPRDEQALTEAIAALSCQPELCAQFAERGRRQASMRFSAEGYMQKLSDFYQRVNYQEPGMKSEKINGEKVEADI